MQQEEFEVKASDERIAKESVRKDSFTRTVFSYLHDMLFLMIFVIVVLVFCLRVVIVSGSSMKNTLVHGDYVLLLSNYFYRNPEQGDIVVACKDSFRNGEPIIKRIIAVEGQEVDIDFDKGIVYVDGLPLSEPYIGSPTNTPEGVTFPIVVEDGCVFVLGDNRMGSQDSRSPDIGTIDEREILGKAIFLLFPGKGKDNLPRDFERIGGFS